MEEPIYATGMAAKLRSQWDRDEGLGQNHKAVKFLGQDYESLKAYCLQSRKLFEDTLFPCAASSLGFKELGPNSAKTSGVRWMRPTVRLILLKMCLSLDVIINSGFWDLHKWSHANNSFVNKEVHYQMINISLQNHSIHHILEDHQTGFILAFSQIIDINLTGLCF